MSKWLRLCGSVKLKLDLFDGLSMGTQELVLRSLEPEQLSTRPMDPRLQGLRTSRRSCREWGAPLLISELFRAPSTPTAVEMKRSRRRGMVVLFCFLSVLGSLHPPMVGLKTTTAAAGADLGGPGSLVLHHEKCHPGRFDRGPLGPIDPRKVIP